MSIVTTPSLYSPEFVPWKSGIYQGTSCLSGLSTGFRSTSISSPTTAASLSPSNAIWSPNFGYVQLPVGYGGHITVISWGIGMRAKKCVRLVYGSFSPLSFPPTPSHILITYDYQQNLLFGFFTSFHSSFSYRFSDFVFYWNLVVSSYHVTAVFIVLVPIGFLHHAFPLISSSSRFSLTFLAISWINISRDTWSEMHNPTLNSPQISPAQACLKAQVERWTRAHATLDGQTHPTIRILFFTALKKLVGGSV